MTRARTLTLAAPAKINWTLEALRVRPDGYHEIRSVMQTLDLCDTLTLRDADDIELTVTGEAATTLSDMPAKQNLAYRAAALLRERAGISRGLQITLEKRVPVAAGLGGGSSDAAAVLRGYNERAKAGLSVRELAALGAELGSDVPFFVHGGTALVSGRGEIVEPLPSGRAQGLLVATPREPMRGEKTAAMFAALSPHEFSEGEASFELRETIEAGREIVDECLTNIFERVTARMQPRTELAMDALRAQGVVPHLTGAGPSFYVLLRGDRSDDSLAGRLAELGFEARAVRTHGG